MTRRAWAGLALALGLVACSNGVTLDEARSGIDDQALHTHIATLSSDAFEGRGPSSAGEAMTLDYLTEQFQALGLEPGPDGSYLQEVPLVTLTADPNTALTIEGRGQTQRFAYGEQYIGWTKRVTAATTLEASDLVFVGYGIVAPEYGWNDYAGLDMTGKTAVILVNDPGFATRNEDLFNGHIMTYYGRWTYKYEEAARQGAAGAIIVHETAPAGYPWQVVSGSWSGPQFDLVRSDNNVGRPLVEGWVRVDAAEALFAQAGFDYYDLAAQAASPAFRPVPLGLTASAELSNRVVRSASHNAYGVLPGSERPDEYVIYTAHWDHLGKAEGMQGDNIFNGALDNASGIAGLLELAEAFTSLEARPARTIVFLAVGAEESGLLGSAYYASNPVYPLAQTAAVINMDGLNIWGAMRDITVVGYGNSELDDYIEAEAEAVGRVVRPDPEPEKGFFYRSDHFSFAKEGVPALYTGTGIDHVENGPEWTLQQRAEYTAQRYHKPADEYDPNWDLSGAVEDLRLLFNVGHRIAMEATWPAWRDGTEFKAKRDAARPPV
ncbi:MAG: M20/M25/M40 family metallo-hydrolase [Bacteroidota bacterium]